MKPPLELLEELLNLTSTLWDDERVGGGDQEAWADYLRIASQAAKLRDEAEAPKVYCRNCIDYKHIRTLYDGLGDPLQYCEDCGEQV
jgi:hypothetical protein